MQVGNLLWKSVIVHRNYAYMNYFIYLTEKTKGYLCWYSIYPISIIRQFSFCSNDRTTERSVLNNKRSLHSTINCSKEVEPDVLNTFCATKV